MCACKIHCVRRPRTQQAHKHKHTATGAGSGADCRTHINWHTFSLTDTSWRYRLSLLGPKLLQRCSRRNFHGKCSIFSHSLAWNACHWTKSVTKLCYSTKFEHIDRNKTFKERKYTHTCSRICIKKMQIIGNLRNILRLHLVRWVWHLMSNNSRSIFVFVYAWIFRWI